MLNSWMTVKVKYTRQMEDGSFKRVSEPYLLAAMSFTDAETRIYEELGMLIRGEFVVQGITRTEVHDIFTYPDSNEWYTCKIQFDSGSDEEGKKGKKVTQVILVSAHSVKEAESRLRDSLKGMMADYRITGVVVSKLMDIFPFRSDEEKAVLAENLKLKMEQAKKAEQQSDEKAMGRKTVFSASNEEDDGDDEEE